MRGAVLALLLALSACDQVPREGPDERGYTWQKDGPTGTPVVHVVSDGNVFLHCAMEDKAKACSVIRNGVCDIYLPAGYEPWLEAHERKHCDGWTHPNSLRW